MSPWFGLEDHCNGVHERFLAALRGHARDWPPHVRPQSSGAYLIDGLLTTYVDLCDPDEGSVVTSLRADFDGSGVYANHVASVGGLGAAGTPESCAAEAARWYLQQLGRPVERHEWFERGKRVLVRWRFAGESGWLTPCEGVNAARPADRVVALG
jgi:hypothetical protein